MTKKVQHEQGAVRYQSGYLRFIEETITLPSGEQFQRDILDHPGAVVIIPVTANGSLLLVDQYRYPMRQNVLEFPAGTIEKGEDILVCARRELQEEVGHDAQEVTLVSTLFPTPGFCNEIQHIFIAHKLFPSRLDGDYDEIIAPREMTVIELETAIRAGEIQDAKTIAAYTQVRLSGKL
ncbi:MAG: NUDIX hydrolase [Bdellovibrionales bacterium]|nr:NUDIX hydrolase [Bdellovibrionales bacterium]